MHYVVMRSFFLLECVDRLSFMSIFPSGHTKAFASLYGLFLWKTMVMKRERA